MVKRIPPRRENGPRSSLVDASHNAKGNRMTVSKLEACNNSAPQKSGDTDDSLVTKRP